MILITVKLESPWGAPILTVQTYLDLTSPVARLLVDQGIENYTVMLRPDRPDSVRMSIEVRQ